MIIINYHQLSARSAPHPYIMPWELFQAQIDALIEHGFSFVTLTDLLQSPSDERPRQCAITFDGGRLGAYQYGSRILRERGIKATYFICPDWLEKHIDCYISYVGVPDGKAALRVAEAMEALVEGGTRE